jgi:alpha-glucan,water dikinase
MNSSQTFIVRGGLKLTAHCATTLEAIGVHMHATVPSGQGRMLLHWGLRRHNQADWILPPPPTWPPGTVQVGPNAVQTPFSPGDGEVNLRIDLGPPADLTALEFVLFFPDQARWDNNGRRNYQVALTESTGSAAGALDRLRALMGTEGCLFERVFDLTGGGQLAVGVIKLGDRYCVRWVCDRRGPLMLHWGIARRAPQEWLVPPASWRGAQTAVGQDQAATTPFTVEEGLGVLGLDVPEAEAPLGIPFVLREGATGERWIHHQGGNFFLPLRACAPAPASPGRVQHADLADEMVRAETTHQSWTLMHRFNLCHDLLDRVRGSVEGQALVYVYLRFSAIRQLTWQRRYNTKPRELAHAQERLTHKLSEIYRHEPGSRPLARLTLATVGRGGEGQRIRDEILNIMHRHHLKEVSGHFLEEWHQKLHNNTTPDDLVICEAYLAFLRANGNLEAYYQALAAGGVTPERLQSFERPIRSRPEFVPHLKEGLIHDFQDFLRILKASHSGTDLETAIQAARGQVDDGLQGLLSYLWESRNAPLERLLDLVRQTTDARRRLSRLFDHSGGLRQLLYLDLALEQLLRGAVERNIHLRLSSDQLADLIACVLENVTLSYEDPELAACLRHWERLQSGRRGDAAWALHAKSVADRMARALSAWMDRMYQLLQPQAEYLGRGFQAEPWTISLFSEEVVRGSSLSFVLSLLLRHLDPWLRQLAHVGTWQIISRGRGYGRVEVVEALHSIQGKRFDSPTVVVADKVTGEEEIPDGVTAVIAPDVIDIVSHVAVRARNAQVFFASCHDPERLQQFKSMRGRHLRLEVSPAGDVLAIETADDALALPPAPTRGPVAFAVRGFTSYAIPLARFDPSRVGGKSCQLARLRGRLPDWIRLPASAALPFGVCEQVLGWGLNQDLARRYSALVEQATSGHLEALPALRETVLGLAAPEELQSGLREAMAAAALPWPDDWEAAWNRIKQVWASKWNERAVLSRLRMNLPHASLSMAVLIQEVVPADYAFVIHTVNPSNGDRSQLLAEVVLGLGETLVGNYPGRALSFVWNKTTREASLLSFPSKSTGLYGDGLIFRSDSNGEDLAGYAGAGLYDSVLLRTPRQVALDYSQERLVWDEAFRQELMSAIARIGVEIERISHSPQDIEGAVAGGIYHVVQTRPQVGLDCS